MLTNPITTDVGDLISPSTANYMSTRKTLEKLDCEARRRITAFECQHILLDVTAIVDVLLSNYVDSAVSVYQKVIRSNQWYFPTIHEEAIQPFLTRWGEVHACYFKLAEEIFAILASDKSVSALATSNLLTKVIQSETMRGWVGKRSPSGLDAMLTSREARLRELLASLDDDDFEDVLFYGGISIGNPTLISAEKETINLLTLYHNHVGQELKAEMLDELNNDAKSLLRDYCKYSIADFNQKYFAFCGTQDRKRPEMTAGEALEIVEQRLAGLTQDERSQVDLLLDEVKILNHLNLNLEVKYSFKSWAGLMHVLVFNACSEVTGIDVDVYKMRNALINKGE